MAIPTPKQLAELETLDLIDKLSILYSRAYVFNQGRHATQWRWPCDPENPERPAELLELESKAQGLVREIAAARQRLLIALPDLPRECFLHLVDSGSTVLLSDGSREWRCPTICDDDAAKRARAALAEVAERMIAALQAQVDGKPPEPAEVKASEPGDWLAKALNLAKKNLGWSNRRIARELDIDHTLLSKHETFRTFRRLQVANPPVRGFRTSEGDSSDIDADSGR